MQSDKKEIRVNTMRRDRRNQEGKKDEMFIVVPRSCSLGGGGLKVTKACKIPQGPAGSVLQRTFLPAESTVESGRMV